MKFSDVVIAAASLFVSSLLFDAVLFVLFAPLNNNSMTIVAGIISTIVTSLIVGYVFAMQIKEESRPKAIGSIVILSTVGLMIFLVAFFGAPLASPAFKDSIQSTFSTGSWTNYDWLAYFALTVAIDVVLSVVVNFIGLYAGSMLRKPKKT